MGLLTNLRNGNGRAERRVEEQLKQERWQNEYLQENMQRLELALEDEGWRRLTLRMEREFTRDGLDELMKISRAMYLSHPLIQRAVNVRSYYTWAQGVTVKAEDEAVQEIVIDPMVAERGNRQTLFGHQARILNDVDQQVDGNTFHALFTEMDGTVHVRCIPVEEIREIICSPDDYTEVWYYRRSYYARNFDQQTGRYAEGYVDCYYPDFTYDPANKPQTIAGLEVHWDAPMIHQRTGGLKNMLFGMPETYAALDWARAYRKFLEDWHTIVASLARFAWRLTTKGSKISRAKERLNTSMSEDEPREFNRQPPAAGATFVGTAQDEITPIPKTGANTSAEDAKPSRLMVGAAMDLPDTILSGDPQQGNLATAKTLDRPTELGFKSRQAMWMDFYEDIFQYAIAKAQKGGQLPQNVETNVSVTFPEILEHDQESTVRAIVSAATLEGKLEAGTVPREQLAKMLLQALGVDNVEEVMENLDDEEEAEIEQAIERMRKLGGDRGDEDK